MNFYFYGPISKGMISIGMKITKNDESHLKRQTKLYADYSELNVRRQWISANLRLWSKDLCKSSVRFFVWQTQLQFLWMFEELFLKRYINIVRQLRRPANISPIGTIKTLFQRICNSYLNPFRTPPKGRKIPLWAVIGFCLL